jgi:hypothetical protein
MDDDTLTPFVDALSATLIIMVLVSISFIVQSALTVADSARKYTEVKLDEDESVPIEFNKPLKIDIDKNELIYLVNFELTPEEVKAIKDDFYGSKSVEFVVRSKDSDKKAAANLLRFLIALNLSKEINVKTRIVQMDESLSKITWSN